MKCPKCGSEMEYVDCTPTDTYPFPKPPPNDDRLVCVNDKCGYEEKVKGEGA